MGAPSPRLAPGVPGLAIGQRQPIESRVTFALWRREFWSGCDARVEAGREVRDEADEVVRSQTNDINTRHSGHRPRHDGEVKVTTDTMKFIVAFPDVWLMCDSTNVKTMVVPPFLAPSDLWSSAVGEKRRTGY
ncbi:hypothetical protein BaRGS_00034390 [Batillaria attramentaria]|uniref:Uncharacterized protein n=1 Tax=Batillaria attramentaria TaxID=370345 RepID=A0ABD0JHF5_9CAEN